MLRIRWMVLAMKCAYWWQADAYCCRPQCRCCRVTLGMLMELRRRLIAVSKMLRRVRVLVRQVRKLWTSLSRSLPITYTPPRICLELLVDDEELLSFGAKGVDNEVEESRP